MREPAAALHAALAAAQTQSDPYRHWLLAQVLPADLCAELATLPVPPPAIGDTHGRRETHNSSRAFFNHAVQAASPGAAALAAALQSPACVQALAGLTGAALDGSYLRIEYSQDQDGFWLEPHTDIGAKFFTMLIYLNDPPPGEEWGTDVYRSPDEHLHAAPGGRNRGLIFVPGLATWHGFERRKITGVRRSLIVNYVTPDWRARHELAFPGATVRLVA